MNKGDSDYLDLDPIRRAVDHLQDASLNRFGQEQVGEYYGKTFGGNNNDANCNTDTDAATAGIQPPIPQDRGSPSAPGLWPDPAIAGSPALLQADLGSNGTTGALANPTTSTRQCLGLVLPIAMPTSFNTVQTAYYGDPTGGPTVACDSVAQDGVSLAFAPVSPDGQHPSTALCPNGLPQPCLLPYHFDPTLPFPNFNFNCISDRISPAPAAVGYSQDRRSLNLHPVDRTGHYVRDNFVNPFIPTSGTGSISAARQARVVSAFYRIHATRTTDKHGSTATIATGCQTFSATDQIGCLVKANTCSIGFAGREAVDLGATPNNFAAQIEGIKPITINIQNLVTPPASPVYPIARTLWVNSIVGRPNITAAADLPQAALYDWMAVPSHIDSIVTTHNFTVVPGAVTNRNKSCPATFP